MNNITSNTKSLLCCLLSLFAAPIISADTDIVTCDPIVSLAPESTTLKKALTQLSKQNGFEYSLPVNADRDIIPPGKMPLSAILRHLTSDLNSIVKTKKAQDCKMPRITEVVILPVGEETQYVYQNQQAEPDKVKEPLIIEDMDIYAEEILLKKRKHQVRLMSPEQRKAFRAARQTAKKRLIEEGLLEPNKPKKERKRKQKQKQSES